MEEALRAYKLVAGLVPDNAEAIAKSTLITLELCDWRDYDALAAATGSSVKDAIANHTSLVYCVQDLHNFSVPAEILAKASNLQGDLVAAEVRGLENFPAFSHGEKMDRWRRGERWRLRVGYALPYTWQHSFPMMMNQFIEFHDRQQFEIFGYCARPSTGTEFEDEYRGKFDHFRDFPKDSPVEAGRMVHDDGIDVLIDVTGHSSINCQKVMVTRPAPVQVEAMGFSLPVGGEYIDYLLTQRDFLGEEFAQYCDETLVYMPDTLFPAYRPPTPALKFTRSDLQLPETGFVFANFNQPFKFDPVMFSVWMQILTRVEGSVLWLGTWREGTQKNLRREAEAHGVDPHRLVFGVIAKHEHHMARIAHAGLLLDNRLHGGGATTMDFLWAGVPMVTCPAQLPVSRNGAMLANALGIPEMVTDSLESYAEFAVGVGNDPGRHRALCEKVKRRRTTHPLFDQQRFTRHFETAIQSIWRQSVFGGTGAITVPPLDAQPKAAAE
jgi:predicted O-linked N-acetylglucosamine transferase (SPINDLY family)